MLAFIDVTNNTQAVDAVEFIGIKAYFTLIDTLAVEDDIILKPKAASLNNSDGYSYLRVTTSETLDSLEAISTFITTAELTIKLVMLDIGGTEYPFLEENRPITEYRIDEGPTSISVIFTSRRSVTDASGVDFTITKFAQKVKNVVSGQDQYTYTIDPLLYKNIGIGKTLTEDTVTMTVTYKALTLSANIAGLIVKGVV